MSTIYNEGIYLTTQSSYGDRRVLYSLGIVEKDRNFTFPGRRQMKRLARKFLNCEHLLEHKEFPRTTRGFFFSIIRGTSAEDRAAFLGAIRHHCKEFGTAL